MASKKELKAQLQLARKERDCLRDERDVARRMLESIQMDANSGAVAELEDTQREKKRLEVEVRELTRRCMAAQMTMEEQKRLFEAKKEYALQAELNRARAVDQVCDEARVREEKAAEAIALLKKQLELAKASPSSMLDTPPVEDTVSDGGPSTSSVSGVTDGVHRAAVSAQQVPTINKFSGAETVDRETIEDWIEQIEIIADAFKWDEATKLVHLTTRLTSAALTFYRSCSADQRRSYPLLREELLQRFTPVHVKSVQSGLFHGRVQQPSESVDVYAQEVKKLFHRAYPQLAREGGEEGKMMLSSRFIAGLRSKLQEKLTGVEGSFEQLLSRARFEEAKRCELQLDKSMEESTSTRMAGRGSWQWEHKESSSKAEGATRPRGAPSQDGHSQNRLGKSQGRLANVTCYYCESKGHYARNCPLKRRVEPHTDKNTLLY